MKLYLSLTLLGYGEAFFYGYRFYKITNQNFSIAIKLFFLLNIFKSS
jgi:hypothetical protein